MVMELSSSGRKRPLESNDDVYIPSLPDDVALDCLLRVTPRSHSMLQGVSRKWRSLISSAEFYEQRKKQGTAHQLVCLLQAAPQSEPQQHPVYYVSMFDSLRKKWERLPPIPEFKHLGLPLFCRLASVPGKLVVIGGWNPGTWETLHSLYIFSFASWTWHRGADMPSTRSFFACAAVGNHHILVAGGHDNTKAALSSADMYNVTANSWESLPCMSSERDELMGVILNGKFLAMGGYQTSNLQCKFVKSAEVYDLDRKEWTQVEDMCNVGDHNAVSTSQGVLGFRDGQVVAYRESKNEWQVVDCLPEERDGISASVSAAGFGCNVVVTGPCKEDDEQYRTFMYRLPGLPDGRGAWEALPVDGNFVGVTLTSCIVEL